MNSMPTIPEPEKIKQTLANAHQNCQEMELAGIYLEEAIVKIEQEILTRRKQQLKKSIIPNFTHPSIYNQSFSNDVDKSE
jgi:hypothetical protein